MKKLLRSAIVVAALLTGVVVWAQREGRIGALPPGTDPRQFQYSGDTPKWTNPMGFEKDVFTFVRITYSTDGGLTSRPSSPPAPRTTGPSR